MKPLPLASIVVAVLLLVPSLAAAQAPSTFSLLKGPAIFLIAGEAFDVATTKWNVANGYQDSNLLYGPAPTTLRLVATKAAMTTAIYLAMRYIVRHRDRDAGDVDQARKLGWIGGGFGFLTGGVNLLIRHEGIVR
jgi:hypothetical protein